MQPFRPEPPCLESKPRFKASFSKRVGNVAVGIGHCCHDRQTTPAICQLVIAEAEYFLWLM